MTYLKVLKLILFFSFVLFIFPFLAFSSPKKTASSSKQSDIQNLDELDFKTRKATRRLIEFEPFVGEYLGNYLNNSFVAGARVAFRITDALSIGTDFNYSRTQFDPNSNFGRSVHSRNEYISNVLLLYAFPILQRTGKTISEADLFTTVGLGNIHINGKNRFVGVLGGGLKVYTKIPWLGFRFDVTTYMYSLPRATDSKFADDWSFTLGPSFLFVPKK